ncbi:carbohydrate ABC transporter permease [[Clostridium] fimetarium]|uniref:Multiple sugar transport system permease protein n=1 Tax=[Clostridium] fimetarium TaxID=99656 RepID=A0A1I0R584_9FIRM|nr:carbohydrate ABC transporter permease [[Clostridium] fimetarium]SEW35725.1 multiple sugar transport system permease protein [[Clostridium] fimetarium]
MKKSKGSDKIQLNIQRAFCYVILVFLSVLCLFSFYILFINTTRSHPDIQKGFSIIPGKSFFVNLNSVLNNKNLPVLSGLMNSVIVSSVSAILATYFSTLTAYAIHAYEFKFKKFAFGFIMVIMMIPTQVSALGFVKLMGDMGLMNSFIPLTVPTIASPIIFFFMKQYMQSALPMDLVEAARIDGAREFRIFNQIVLPIMKPAIAVQAIFTFVFAWNNYFIPALLLNKDNKKTLPILIAQLRSADFLKFDMGQVYMLIAISIFPVIIVYLILSKNIVSGITLGSVKG